MARYGLSILLRNKLRSHGNNYHADVIVSGLLLPHPVDRRDVPRLIGGLYRRHCPQPYCVHRSALWQLPVMYETFLDYHGLRLGGCLAPVLQSLEFPCGLLHSLERFGHRLRR